MSPVGSLDVPTVGVGCNSFGTWADEASSLAIVQAALDAGAAFFDTADFYGNGSSELLLGQALAGHRDEALVATKFGIMGGRPGHGRADAAFVRSSLQDSLRRLGTDHVDLYQLHYPDADTPVEDTMAVLVELVDEGLVREVGVCNVTAELVDTWAGAATSTVRVAAVQNEWSLLRRGIEDEALPTCRRHDVPVLPYFPLASGMLTGKYDRDRPPPPDSRMAKSPALVGRYRSDADLDVVDALSTFAHARGHGLLELAISWLAGRPEVATVITGASKPEQVHANVAAAGWRLTADDRAVIDEITARS